ncbi:hypothetical protein BIFPSEUDO_02667 [Bifidobacterium pseudocatenulatum DSM 20438 = JCM 1200 = LMG 10505]|uniref:Uncharacterized protein n=1 Tax=Bifidobacterium pseudocatenulatum DSM 20438 = JCM 1200 = LMG 10505 TaxID=547043 RepID=C0BQL6_BIFPS|nr:hypothetical protein BIFPSEUDO_02667 [Bifidobacterium pseudocatenulatum DSM 20438 = JCM 1200 = LMG 10505]
MTNANTACRDCLKSSKSLKFQRFSTISYMSAPIRANPHEKIQKRKIMSIFSGLSLQTI